MPVGTARSRITQHEVLRRQRGLMTKDIASAIGVSSAYVSLIEGGLKPASPRYRKGLSDLLKVPEDIIFDDQGRVR